jgi:hypothetical protein
MLRASRNTYLSEKEFFNTLGWLYRIYALLNNGATFAMAKQKLIVLRRIPGIDRCYFKVKIVQKCS